MKNILMIIGKSQYDSTKIFLKEIKASLEQNDVTVDVLDCYDEANFSSMRKQMHTASYDAVISINGMALEEDSSLGKEILNGQTIYCTMLMDHPLIHHERLKNTYPYSFVLSPDQKHVEYLEKYYPNIWCEAFLAHGGCQAKSIVPYEERSIDISFMGSYSNPEEVWKEFGNYPSQMQAILEHCGEYLIQNTNSTLEEGIQHIFSQMGLQVSEEEFAAIGAEFRIVDRYVRSYYRDKVIRTLVTAGIEVDVYGDGWEQLQEEIGGNLRVHHRVGFEESLEIVADSKISLNVMPWFKDGSHDRVFTAMLCESICLTDSSKYLEEACQSGENVIFYSLDQLEELPAMVNEIIGNQQLSAQIAKNGRALAEKKHTWAVRGKEILDYLLIAEQMRENEDIKTRLESQILSYINEVGSPHTSYNPEGIVALGKALETYIAAYSGDEKNNAYCGDLWKQIAALPETKENSFGKIMAEYELLEYVEDGEMTDYYLQQILNCTELGWRNQLYLLNQLNGVLFTGNINAGKNMDDISWKLYNKIFDSFCKEVGDVTQWIPSQLRNPDLVIVTTSQLLSEQHAPTKTALDRCYILMQECGKEVILLNTAEMGADIGNMILFHRFQTNYKEELFGKESISYKGIEIPYIQCSRRMPEIAETIQILEFIQEKKPSYVVNIGGGSLVSDMISKMVPVLTVATVFSKIATTNSQYQTIGRSLNEKDKEFLARRGKTENHVISGRFTFALKEQTQILSREALGIPKDAFAIVVIGARLTREVTIEFVDALLGTVAYGGFLVFVGELDYKRLLREREQLREHSVYLGSRSDVLAIMEQMDLYANPYRNGGGSSVVEAMSKGVVPVTLPYGDVYVNTGTDFAVADYQAMQEEMIHYMKDKAYYNQQSEKAIVRAEELMDSTSAFQEILREFENRIASDFLISVIIPCYNAELYLERCLDSVIHQTIGFEKIQLIIVDDASTDNSLKILKNYEERYPDNILLIPLEKNQGQGAARNIAMEYATGGYISFLDADDWVELDMYERLCQVALHGNCEMTFCQMDRIRTYTNSEVRKEEPINKAKYIELNQVSEREKFIYQNRENIMCTNKLFERKFLQKHQIRFVEGLKFEDHFFGMLALLSVHKLAILEENLYHWYQNPKSTCMSGKGILDRIDVHISLYQECEQRGYLNTHKELLQYNLYEKMVAETIFYMRQRGEDTTEVLKQISEILRSLQIDIKENKYFLMDGI